MTARRVRTTSAPSRPHRSSVSAGKAELGYMFLPQARGFGYAAEACAAALAGLGDALPGEPVVLYTQTANTRSMRLAAKPGVHRGREI
jgi:RimJ/RimL family protein N-acetyltransferase